MPKALLFPMRYGQLLRSYSAWARINSSSISCDSSCRQQFRLIASLWAGSPRVDEVSRSITGYIYIFIYLFLFIYLYIYTIRMPGIAWNFLDPGAPCTDKIQQYQVVSEVRMTLDMWCVWAYHFWLLPFLGGAAQRTSSRRIQLLKIPITAEKIPITIP